MQETQHSTIYASTKSDLSSCETYSPFTHRPPPWYMQGEGWWMVLSLLRPSRKLLKHVKHLLDEESTSSGLAPSDSFRPHRGFRGGIGNVQIIRYDTSPVGPYDELLIIPSAFKPPSGSIDQSPGLRITQLYVSTLESVLNGRRNWNTPKKLARFKFTEVEGCSNKIKLEVYALRSFGFTPFASSTGWYFEPNFYETPFFNVIMDRHLPSVNIPVKLKQLPMLDLPLLQPPLQAADPLDPQSPEINCGMVGTSEWKRTRFSLKGRCGLCSFTGNLSGRKGQFSDGDHFPDIQPYRLGIHFPRVYLKVPAPTTLSTPEPRPQINKKSFKIRKTIHSYMPSFPMRRID